MARVWRQFSDENTALSFTYNEKIMMTVLPTSDWYKISTLSLCAWYREFLTTNRLAN